MTVQNQQEKFYPLTEAEFLKTLQLKSAERDLLLYLRILTATNTDYEINTAYLADRLGRHKTTITRALNVLKDKGFINFSIIPATTFIQTTTKGEEV